MLYTYISNPSISRIDWGTRCSGVGGWAQVKWSGHRVEIQYWAGVIALARWVDALVSPRVQTAEESSSNHGVKHALLATTDTQPKGVYVWKFDSVSMVVGIREGCAELGDGWIVIKRQEWQFDGRLKSD